MIEGDDMQVGRNFVDAAVKTREKLYRTNYVASAQLDESIISNISTSARFLRWIDLNSGENLNNIITAVGTAGVAPIFIVKNPFAKNEDPKIKAYSAWRQPISATIQLACLTPVAVAWNKQVDNWASFGRWKDMDLSMKPLASSLHNQLSAEYTLKEFQYKNGLVEFLDAGGNSVENFPTKKEFIANRMKEIHQTKFSEELARLRKTTIIDDEIWAKLNEAFKDTEKFNLNAEEIKIMKKKNFIPKSVLNKLSEVGVLTESEFKFISEIKGYSIKPDELNNIKNLLKPDDINSGRTAVMNDLFAKDASTGVNKLNVAELPKGINKFEDLTSKEGRRFLKKQGLVPKDIIKQIEKSGFNLAKENLAQKIDSEAAVKTITSKSYRNMLAELTERTSRIKLNLPAEEKLVITMDMHKRILIDEIAKLKDLESLEVKKVTSATGQVGTSRILEPIRGAITKLEKVLNTDCRIDLMKDHGSTTEQVLRSVRLKKYLMAKIQKAENVHKGFKQFTGIPVAIISVIGACYALNWLYPRFMEKFLPELASAKNDSSAKKNAPQEKTAGVASLKQDTLNVTTSKNEMEVK